MTKKNPAAEAIQDPNAMIEDGLVVIPQASIPTIFSCEGAILSIVRMIKSEAENFTPDLSTAKGRAEIKSRAYKVKRSKTILDDIGKDLTSEYREKVKNIDVLRKIARDQLDNISDLIRQPLDDWEAEQERIAREEAEAIERERQRLEAEAKYLSDWDLAIIEDGYRTQQKKIAEQEAELQKLRDEKEAREKAELAKIEEESRKEKERLLAEKLRQEAEAEAERVAQEKIRIAQEEADRKVQEEKDRQERERLAEEKRKEDERIAQEKREANKRHCAKINNEALDAIVLIMADNHSGNKAEAKKIAKSIVEAIAKGMIPNVTISY